jgi:hypothetical protein
MADLITVVKVPLNEETARTESPFHLGSVWLFLVKGWHGGDLNQTFAFSLSMYAADKVSIDVALGFNPWLAK